MRGVKVLNGARRAVPAAGAVLAALTLAVTDSDAASTASQPASQPTMSATMSATQPAPKVTFEPARFAELPGWSTDDHLAALKTFLLSCGKVMKAATAEASAKSAVSELARVCRAAADIKKPTREAARAFFEAQLVPHRVVHDGDRGFLTGYYEPVLKGSRKPEGPFQTPVYRRPPDLVNVVAETQRASMPDGLTHVRQTPAGVAPFPTRAEIEQGALKGKGLELLYLADPVDTFFMHIQGSGRIELTDGTTVRLHYDGKNGHPYTSIGRYLIAKGLFPADSMSLQSLRKWLRADHARGQQVMWQNASFIFFRELEGRDGEGPLGALSVPLTPGRSLAVDTAYHTLGTPIYVAAPSLKHASRSADKTGGFNRLMVAQDVGSAIKGPERGDIYFGSGDKAGRLAGVTKNAATFFVLLPATQQDAAQNAEQSREPSSPRQPWPKIEKAER